MLQIIDLELSFDNKILFKNFTFKLKNGEIGLISAPSGKGKTTLLKWIAGIHISNLNSKGKLYLNKIDISKKEIEDRKIGILFQKPFLFPNLTVKENLYFAMQKRIRGIKERKKIINKILSDIELPQNSNDPSKLSSGQLTRVALVMTFLSKPNLILLDEPFSSLDAKIRKKMFDFVKKNIKDHNIPLLITSHDPRDLKEADNIIKI